MSTTGGGCVHPLTMIMAQLWLMMAPIASAFLANAVVGGQVPAKAEDGVTILVTALATIVPFAGAALLLKRRRGPRSVVAAASSLAIASGYLVLDAVVRMALPGQEALIPLRSRYTVAALRLAVLVPYAALTARLGQRLVGMPRRPVRGWLGLGRPQGSTCLLAVAAAALVTVPWPVTGALGDSLTSLAVSVQMLSSVIPQVLIYWGVIFNLLTASFDRTEMAAMTMILVYVLSASGRVPPQGDIEALTNALFLFPLAVLLTEMRARGETVWPLLPLALCYWLLPALFIDPRDAIANGIPELQHLLSYVGIGLAATVLGVLLWMGRRRMDNHRRGRGADGRDGRAAGTRRYPRRMPFPYGVGGSGKGVQGNLAAIHADAAWDLGVLGQGIVVGGQDTGYDWDHPALKRHYRGWDGERADHNCNWHDAWDDTVKPFDDGSHGTHTMGTILGDDGGENRTGVAPEATWIGCRNMRRGIGNPGSYAECMEFLLAPYPLGGDPFRDGDVGRAPHVINNSWGCPYLEGCLPETLRPAVEAFRAAGIMMVVSAGNEGPACGTVSTPPANYDASFSVGATTEGGTVVGFSSRGPADGLVKPDITAPGWQVRSSVPGGSYGTLGGTSMAGPNVAGVAALVWSADESLIGDVDATEELLCRTALAKPVKRSCASVSVSEGLALFPFTGNGSFSASMTPPACACGGVSDVPNNVYGCGVVDAGAAVEQVLKK